MGRVGAPVVGCAHRESSGAEAALSQGFEEGNAQRCALDRLRARADFVQQHQRLPISFLPKSLRKRAT